jgi:two-component system sensor histidine kinase KdpD
MANDKRLIDALIAINSISNDRRLPVGRKLQDILLEVVECMKAKSGSIMLVKSRKSLEVIASTNVELIGVKQHVDEE